MTKQLGSQWLGGLVAALGVLCANPAFAQITVSRALNETIDVADPVRSVIIIDNVFGSIHVTGSDSDVVQLSGLETIRGDSQADVDKARREIELGVTAKNDRIAVEVRNVGENCRCNLRWDGYTVEYQLELRVPRAASVELATVNGGEITLADVEGEFAVSNVNGPIVLSGLRSAGRAKTVNGSITAVFAAAPGQSSTFRTVNGDIDVSFPSDLSSDLRFKTMRGEIWSEYDVTPLAAQPVLDTSRGARYTVRSQDWATVRVGSGGPAHSFETLHGDIVVRKLRP